MLILLYQYCLGLSVFAKKELKHSFIALIYIYTKSITSESVHSMEQKSWIICYNLYVIRDNANANHYTPHSEWCMLISALMQGS